MSAKLKLSTPLIILNQVEELENLVPESEPSNEPWKFIDKQIHAFEELVNQMVRKSESLDDLHIALTYITDCPFGTPRLAAPSTNQLTQRSSQKERIILDSVNKLREQLTKLQKRSSRTSEENNTIGTLENMLKDYQYMRSLKKYFDEKIYCLLYRHFYDPFVVVIDENINEGSESKTLVGIEEEEDEGGPVFLTESLLIDPDQSAKKSKLESIESLQTCVNEIYLLNKRWEILCSSDELCDENFESESLTKLSKFEGIARFESLLRLIPDMLCKCQKLIQFAKQWLDNYHSAYGDMDPGVLLPPSVDELNRKVGNFDAQVQRKESEIRHMEHLKNIHTKELAFLTKKEERVKSLIGNCDKITAHRTAIGENYRSMIRKRQNTMNQLDNTIQGTQKYKELSTELRKIETDLLEVYRELKLAEYGLEVTQSDCLLEAEAATDFVIFSEAEKEKLEKLEEELKSAQQTYSNLLLQSELVSHNFKIMKEILITKTGPKFVHSESASEGRELVLPLNNRSRAVVSRVNTSSTQKTHLTNATYTIKTADPKALQYSSDRYSEKTEFSEDEAMTQRKMITNGPSDPYTKPQKVVHTARIE